MTAQLNLSTKGDAPRGFNWGAFFLTWIWGIFNKTWLSFLWFAPMGNFIMPFVLGFKGNQWAWENAEWRDVEHFQTVQRRWALAGLISCALGILLVIAIIGAVVFGLLQMKKLDPYHAAYVAVQNNEQAKQLLGEPIHDGYMFSGNIDLSGGTGKADVSFDVSGPRGEGTVYLNAERTAGKWITKTFVLQPKGSSKRIQIAPQGSELNSLAKQISI